MESFIASIEIKMLDKSKVIKYYGTSDENKNYGLKITKVETAEEKEIALLPKISMKKDVVNKLVNDIIENNLDLDQIRYIVDDYIKKENELKKVNY